MDAGNSLPSRHMVADTGYPTSNGESSSLITVIRKTSTKTMTSLIGTSMRYARSGRHGTLRNESINGKSQDLPIKSLTHNHPMPQITDFVSLKCYGDKELIAELKELLSDHGYNIKGPADKGKGYVTKNGNAGHAQTINLARPTES